MSRKKLFIGSASESKEVVEAIAKVLHREGFKPCKWWNEFAHGEYTLERLMQLSKEVDGAILICLGSDHVWFRGHEEVQPRDNCILEYGMLLSQLGRRRTVLVHDGKSKLPSDIDGITLTSLSDGDVEHTAESIANHFKDVFGRSHDKTSSPALILDPFVIRAEIENRIPGSWNARCLYLGDQGAANWLTVVNEPEYSLNRDPLNMKELRLDAIKSVDSRTVVSFGPGDGKPDRAIVRAIRSREPLVEYIPVDISIGLLERTVATISEDVRVAIGIVGDFEEGQAFIRDQVAHYAKRPILYCILGGTMGNLDRGEFEFLTGLKDDLMTTEDRLLLDVGLQGPNWKWTDEGRTQHQSYTGAVRRFMSLGISRRTGEKTESIVERFEERIRFATGQSDVPGCVTITASDVDSKHVLVNNRRYDWKKLIHWLEGTAGLSIDFEASRFDSEGVTGMGVMLVRKKNS